MIFFISQPSHNDKYSNQEMIQVMNELAKARKQLKGIFPPGAAKYHKWLNLLKCDHKSVLKWLFT